MRASSLLSPISVMRTRPLPSVGMETWPFRKKVIPEAIFLSSPFDLTQINYCFHSPTREVLRCGYGVGSSHH